MTDYLHKADLERKRRLEEGYCRPNPQDAFTVMEADDYALRHGKLHVPTSEEWEESIDSENTEFWDSLEWLEAYFEASVNSDADESAETNRFFDARFQSRLS